ncbi:MAG: 3-oxoacyl-ACP reductase [Myxococcales bacterium]|nr:3-oxoacyl-ACP reductase [Myxococcales bacterium]
MVDRTISASASASAAATGAVVFVAGDSDLASKVEAGGGEFAVAPKAVNPGNGAPASMRAHAFVCDATEINDAAGLRALYDFFHPFGRSIAPNGRLVIIGRPPADEKKPERAAAQNALEGFVRAYAKEIGKSGATCNLLHVKKGAEDRLDGPLRFLLSKHSAYVTGQPLTVDAKAAAAQGADRRTGQLEGKVALVTGGARGIGAATAQRLADEGAKVIVLDRPADAEETEKTAQAVGGAALLLDVTDPAAPAKISDYVADECGGVDIVVHNAGVTRDKTLKNMKPELWDLTLEINLAAIARITDALLKKGLNDGGRIVCLSSIAGVAGNAGQTNYSASKAGVIGYVRNLGPSLAKRGITANAVAPGFIETRMTAAMPFAIREAARRMNSLGQGGQPLDIAEAVTFFASPAAHGVTGQVLRVCGQSLVGA